VLLALVARTDVLCDERFFVIGQIPALECFDQQLREVHLNVGEGIVPVPGYDLAVDYLRCDDRDLSLVMSQEELCAHVARAAVLQEPAPRNAVSYLPRALRNEQSRLFAQNILENSYLCIH